MSRKVVRFKVEVTEQDIRDGKRSDCARCPVAKAIARLPGVYHVEVGKTSVGISFVTDPDPHSIDENELPPEARQFVRWFDRYDDRARPFSFELDVFVPA